MILDTLPPQPPIEGAFEVVILGSLAKAALNQRHAAAPVAACFAALRLCPALQEEFVAFGPHDKACMARMGGATSWFLPPGVAEDG